MNIKEKTIGDIVCKKDGELTYKDEFLNFIKKDKFSTEEIDDIISFLRYVFDDEDYIFDYFESDRAKYLYEMLLYIYKNKRDFVYTSYYCTQIMKSIFDLLLVIAGKYYDHMQEVFKQHNEFVTLNIADAAKYSEFFGGNK